MSQFDLLHDKTVRGIWMTVVAHLKTRCLCIDQVAVTRLVGSTRWLVTRFILRGRVVGSEFIWTHSCALIDERLRTYFVA